MGKHSKTESQERIFYENQFVLPKGAFFVPKRREWKVPTGEEFDSGSWVDLPGKHVMRDGAELWAKEFGGKRETCDVCIKAPAVHGWDDLFGYMCNLCFVKHPMKLTANFMTGEKIVEGIRYPPYMVDRSTTGSG